MNLGNMLDGKASARRLSRLLGDRDAKLRTLQIAVNAILAFRRSKKLIIMVVSFNDEE